MILGDMYDIPKITNFNDAEVPNPVSRRIGIESICTCAAPQESLRPKSLPTASHMPRPRLPASVLACTVLVLLIHGSVAAAGPTAVAVAVAAPKPSVDELPAIRQVLVLGYHNTGTSITTKILMLMGLYAGEPSELLLSKRQGMRSTKRS